MSDIYKQFAGFNIDVIKPGAMFYVNIINNDQHNIFPPNNLKDIVGNVIILRSDPFSFELQRAIDITRNEAIVVNIWDIKNGIVTIKEMRELK